MISGIKIYNPNGKLKEEISQAKAQKLYDNNNKENWSLSPAEKRWWKTFSSREAIEQSGKGNGRGGIGIRYKPYKKRTAKYKCICIICSAVTMKMSPSGKFCGDKCRGVHRRSGNKAYYQKRKNSFA